MGYLTTIVIHNDALHRFENNPEKFAKAIFDGIRNANREHKEVDVGFEGYCNYISIHPSRHADDDTVYVHTGNTVFNLNAWNTDFWSLAKQNPTCLKMFIKRAQGILTDAKKRLKEITN